MGFPIGPRGSLYYTTLANTGLATSRRTNGNFSITVTRSRENDARSGEALDKVRTKRCDLVLPDNNMPGMNGWETCRLICSARMFP